MMNNEEPPLKSIYKRMRATSKRTTKIATKKITSAIDRNVHKRKYSEIAAQKVESDKIKRLIKNEKNADWIGEIVKVREQMANRLQQCLSSETCGNEEWRKRLTDIDIYYLNLNANAAETTKSTIFKLPLLLDKLHDLSSLDVLPSNYRRDHLWLTLQTEIDEVDNPFHARACGSTACLGLFIASEKREGEEQPAKTCVLPEMTPLHILDEYRELRSKGIPTIKFKEMLQERVDKGEAILGSNVWEEPKCALCRMQDIFCSVMSPLYKKHVISHAEYISTYGLQFSGMRHHLTANTKDAGFFWCLAETGVSLPSMDIPLIGLVVSAIHRNGKEVVINDLYE